MECLITQNQIYSNLRRTASEGLISVLSYKQLNDLALKYYGVYRDGKLIGYECPYSGEILTDSNNIVLEHIIPISSSGGTVLFNCIPVSEQVNKSSEKGKQHLLSWWISKEYFNPEKLNKLMSYIFEAYDITFNGTSISEIQQSFDSMELIFENNNFTADLSITSKNETSILQQQASETGIISYLKFINDCILELKKRNFDTTIYEEKLKDYEKKNVFKDVDRYTNFQTLLRQAIKTKLNEDNRKELNYILNIDIVSLMDSMKEFNNLDDIYNEILGRLNNIETILEKNNIGIVSFFEDVRNQDILYKRLSEITELDKKELVSKINLCIDDKFKKFLDFVKNNNGQLPGKFSQSEQEYSLMKFMYSMKYYNGKNNYHVKLSKQQLECLRNSEYESLRNIYKEILYKSIDKNIEIEYVDETMANRIKEYLTKTKNATIEEEIVLMKQYEDVVVTDNQFYALVNYVMLNNGKLPLKKKVKVGSSEDKLSQYICNIKNINTARNQWNSKLTRKELMYLRNSEYESLRNIYKEILYKSIEKNIEIEYVDETMANRIKEYLTKVKNAAIEEEIVLMKQYEDVVIFNNTFNELILYSIKNNGILPYKEKLIAILCNVKTVDKRNKRFCKNLSKEQLEYLRNSEYESLRNVYKEILYKSIKYNIKIEYVDEEMLKKIREYLDKSKDATIEQQIELNCKYENMVLIESQFYQFINYVIKNKGTLPSRDFAETEQDYSLGVFRTNIQVVKNSKTFHTPLTKQQLEYLRNSEYESLRNIYKVILNRAIKNNIKIEYVDEAMTNRIKEYLEKSNNATIEEQIYLNEEYKKFVVIEGQFYQFIQFVIENNGALPRKSAEKDYEKKLGAFRGHIQSFDKKHNKFFTPLTKEQLNYLYCSENEELRNIYNNIIAKSYENRFEEYIKIDNEIKNEVKNRRIA